MNWEVWKGYYVSWMTSWCLERRSGKKEHDEGPEAVLTRLNRARITLKPDIF